MALGNRGRLAGESRYLNSIYVQQDDAQRHPDSPPPHPGSTCSCSRKRRVTDEHRDVSSDVTEDVPDHLSLTSADYETACLVRIVINPTCLLYDRRPVLMKAIVPNEAADRIVRSASLTHGGWNRDLQFCKSRASAAIGTHWCAFVDGQLIQLVAYKEQM